MKQLLLLALSIVLLHSAASAQDIVNLRLDANYQGLRGAVASLDEDILVKKEYFRDDWPERKWFRQDLRNCLTEEEGRIYTFNAKGQLTSMTYTSRGVAGEKVTCKYAKNGLLTNFLGEGYKAEAQYKGSAANINIYAETKNYSRKIDLATADLTTAPYTNAYPFDMKCVQELSDGGLIMSSSYYYLDSMPVRTCTYSYTHRDQLQREEILDYTKDAEHPAKTVVTYTYDGNGYLVQKTIKSKAINDVYRYVNNEFGDCIELTIERPYETVSYTFEYAYDEWDNWVRRLQFKNGAFDCAALRTLTYHKAGKAVAETSHMDEEDMPRAKAKAAKSEKQGLFAKLFKKKDKATAEQPKAKAKKGEAKVAEPKAKKEKASAKDEQPKAKVSKKGNNEPKAKKEKADKPKEKKAKVKKNDNSSANTPDELKSKPSKKDKVSKAKKEKVSKEGKSKKHDAQPKVKKSKKAKADKDSDKKAEMKAQAKAEKAAKKAQAKEEKASKGKNKKDVEEVAVEAPSKTKMKKAKPEKPGKEK